MKKHFFTLILMTLAVGCAAPKVRVESNPEGAEVYLANAKSQDKKFIGKTPLEIDLKKFSDQVQAPPASRQFVRIVTEKKDYDSKELLVPVGSFGVLDTTVRVKLDPSKPKSDNSKLVVQYLVNAQELINRGDFDRADLEVERSIQLEGSNPWAYSMRGHIYLLKKDYKKSLAAFEKAIEIDPSNEVLLKKIVNTRNLLREKLHENNR